MVIDAGAILCERCGYDVTGLEARAAREAASPCPECGRAIVDSLPERRVGSAWQRGAGFGAALRTNLATVRRPLRRWAEVAAERRSGVNLAVANCAAAGLLWGVVMARSQTVWHQPGSAARFAALAAGATAGAAAVLMLCCAIERVGIGLFGLRRGWRTSAGVAWAVVGHASVGWLLMPATAAVAAALSGAYINRAPAAWSGLLMWDVWRVGFALAPLFVGMVAFEMLVYVGWRAMRYANHPRAGSVG